MTDSTNAGDRGIKALSKNATVEGKLENKDKLSYLSAEILEGIGLSRAIEEGEKSKSVSREEVFKVLRS